jgi:hypothetical protein
MECTPSVLHRPWRDGPLDRSPWMGCPAHAPRYQKPRKESHGSPLFVSPPSRKLSPAWLGESADASGVELPPNIPAALSSSPKAIPRPSARPPRCRWSPGVVVAVPSLRPGAGPSSVGCEAVVLHWSLQAPLSRVTSFERSRHDSNPASNPDRGWAEKSRSPLPAGPAGAAVVS